MKRISAGLILAPMVMLVAACGGGGGSTDTAGPTASTTPTTTPTPTATPTATTTPTPTVTRSSIPSSTTGTTGIGTAAGSTSSGLASQNTGPSTGRAATDWKSSATATEAFSETITLSAGQRRTHGFSVTGSALDLEILFVAQTSANLFVMPLIEENNFLNGLGFSYMSGYSFPPGNFGIKDVSSVPPGEYIVGIENTSAVSNKYRVEVQQQPLVSGFVYSNDRFKPVVQNAPVGTRFIQYVTLGSTYRTIIDGANTGGTLYLLPGSEANNFLSGSSFQYITDNPCGSDSAAPGFCELRFADGLYALAYVNDTSSPQAFLMYGRDYVPQ